MSGFVMLQRAKVMVGIAQKDFSKKTLTALSRKGVSVIGVVAVPAFEGDKYFSGVAYQLEYKGTSFLRRHFQILCMANSSWSPDAEGAI